MPPLMISVWDAETRLSIAARASADGNEVKATLEALKSLDLKGCVVTADALHRHPKMAEAVRERGGHYALKLKGNNGPLHARAVAAFAKADARGGEAFHEKSENGHDRFERRRASLAAATKDANFAGSPCSAAWKANDARPAAKPPRGFIMSRCPNASPHASCCGLSESVGASRVRRRRTNREVLMT